jgi:hypothetical protein
VAVAVAVAIIIVIIIIIRVITVVKWTKHIAINAELVVLRNVSKLA